MKVNRHIGGVKSRVKWGGEGRRGWREKRGMHAVGMRGEVGREG